MSIQPETDWRSDASIAYAMMRLTFGVNLFMRGVMRIYMGTGVFAQGMVKQFEGTPMPRGIITPFALMLPWAETAIGLLIILGLQTRVALIVGSLMMMVLTFGTMVRQDFQTAWLQLGYVLMFFLLLALRSWNLISLDAGLQRSQQQGGRT